MSGNLKVENFNLWDKRVSDFSTKQEKEVKLLLKKGK